ncbi:MAG: O-antigen ligase family protein [Clostridia bacterium]
MLEKIRIQKLSNKFEKILGLYIILQPIIDIITSLCVRNSLENLSFGIFIRTLFMVALAIYTLIKSDKKDRCKILIYYFCIALYAISYLANSYIKNGLSTIFVQIKGLIKTFYFPVVLSSLLVIYKNRPYSSKKKYLSIALSIYVLTIFILKMFSVGYPTYPLQDSLGTIGLFFAGNEISAILALLSPICFIMFFNEKFNVSNAILCFLTVYCMLEVGTKTSFISIVCLIIVAFIIAFIKLLKDKNFHKQFIIMLLIVLFSVIFVGNSSAGKNLGIQPLIFQSQGNSQSDLEDNSPNEPAETPTELLSSRDIYLKDTINEYKNSNIIDKIVGRGYVSNYDNIIQESKLIEIDYFDIFFCHGFLGVLVYIVPLVIVIGLFIKKFFTNFINNIKNHTLIFLLYSLLIVCGIALMAGHVFTAPAVSLFLILNILEIFYTLNYEKDLKNE